MNAVKIVSLALLSTFVLFSCKKEKKPTPASSINPEKELALAEKILSEKTSSTNYLYVTASSGLSLREYPNLQSEKLAIMPYGTRVKVIASEKKPTMKVGEILGGMDEVEFNQKKGFTFNGCLSKYFPPEKGVTAERYAEISFTKTIGGTVSKPTNTETLKLPKAKWHEAFYIAQNLFNIPKKFVFPSSKGKEFQTIKEKNFENDSSTKLSTNSWTSELQITRKDNAISKIEYVYKNKGFLKKVTIIKNENALNISNFEIVE